MKISAQTIPCVIIDDVNDRYEYGALIEEYTKEVEKLENNRQKMFALERLRNEFKDDYFMKLFDFELFKFKVVARYRGLSDLKNGISKLDDNEDYIFLIDYQFGEVNEVTTGIEIKEFLMENFYNSRFIMLTGVALETSFVARIVNAGFDGIIAKEDTIEPWDIGSFLNRVWRNDYFEFETKAYETFIYEIKKQPESEITERDIMYINDIAQGLDMYEMAEKYLKNDPVMDIKDEEGNFIRKMTVEEVKLKNKKGKIEGITAYNRFKNFRTKIIKQVAKKLGSKSSDRCAIIKAGFKYLTKETLQFLIKENYDFDVECSDTTESSAKQK